MTRKKTVKRNKTVKRKTPGSASASGRKRQKKPQIRRASDGTVRMKRKDASFSFTPYDDEWRISHDTERVPFYGDYPERFPPNNMTIDGKDYVPAHVEAITRADAMSYGSKIIRMGYDIAILELDTENAPEHWEDVAPYAVMRSTKRKFTIPSRQSPVVKHLYLNNLDGGWSTQSNKLRVDVEGGGEVLLADRLGYLEKKMRAERDYWDEKGFRDKEWMPPNVQEVRAALSTHHYGGDFPQQTADIIVEFNAENGNFANAGFTIFQEAREVFGTQAVHPIRVVDKDGLRGEVHLKVSNMWERGSPLYTQYPIGVEPGQVRQLREVQKPRADGYGPS